MQVLAYSEIFKSVEICYALSVSLIKENEFLSPVCLFGT